MIKAALKLAPLVLLLALSAVGAEAAKKPTIVFLSGEDEYEATNTLPAFARYVETNFPVRCVYLERQSKTNFPGLEALERADLAIVFIRRMTLPENQLARIRKYVQSGKPLIGLRTASHAFENWKEFDHDVLGGNYQGHHGNKLVATARIAPDARSHPILKGVAPEFVTAGSLYKTSSLATNTTALLIGSVPDAPPEPLAWTHTYRGARIFYTSLGHPKDFENPNFRQLLVNAIFGALNQSAANQGQAMEPNTTKR